MPHRRLAHLTRLLLFVCLIAAGSSFGQAARDPLFDALTASLQKARSEQVDALAPTQFAAAMEALDSATKDAERRRNPERIRARLAEGVAAVEAATQSAAN